MMQRRQQYLIGGLLAAVVIWQASGWISSTVFEPFQTASEKLETLKKSVANKNENLRALAKAAKSLKEWKATSLPPDPGKSKQPTAVIAQRQYMEWVTDLAELCGFVDTKIQPGTTTTKGKVYISVIVKLDADAHFEQLVKFLDLFYRTELLHRISSLRVSTKVFEGDPQLKISLEAEGLALLDAPPRRTLFPETKLTTPLSEDGTSLQVENAKEFPKEPGFRIKVRNEFLKVTAVDGETWTLVRGIERTAVAAYSENTTVELVRLQGNQDRTLEEIREMISTNIFVKPSPKYRMKLGPFGEKTAVRGKSFDFTITPLGYDSLLGRPEYVLTGDVPSGMKLDRNGKLSWKPDKDMPAGKYPVTVEVRHPSAPDGRLTETLTIRLREPGAAPKFSDAKPPKVYLNREWKYRPELVISGANSSTSKFTWKLGDKAPNGLSINDKSGELNWVPGDDIPIGETVISVIVNDGESPPQSTTIPLTITVEDDAAGFTRLTGIVAIGSKKRAFLFDPSTDKKTELHEGDGFAISEVSGTIKSIYGKYLVVSLDNQEVRWDIGQSLREAKEKMNDY